MPRPLSNLVGEPFGRLVVKRLHKRGEHDVWWLCDCSCGKSKPIRQSILRRGDAVSCGCYRLESARKRARIHPISNGKTKYCAKCDRFRKIKFFWKSSSTADGLGAWCRNCHKDNQEQNRNNRKSAGLLTLSTLEYRRLRLEVLTHYSSGEPQCECCGEKKIEFLAIDHINGGGRKHRASLKTSIYRYLRKHGYPSGYRVMCHNCNQSLGQYGYCPHKTKPEHGKNYRSRR